MRHGGFPWNKGYPSNINDFSVNLNPLGTPRFVDEIINEAIRLGIHKYYPPEDYSYIKSIIGEIYGVDKDFIGVFNGASEAINLLDNDFIVPQPNYSDYKYVSYYNAEEMEDKFRFMLHKKYRKIILSNPNNPTGAYVSVPEIEDFLRSGNELVVDESFIDISLTESSVKLVEEYKNLLIINSFTKSFSIPGLRIGFTIGQRSKEIEKRAPSWRVNSLAYYLISHLDPKEVRTFFYESKMKTKELIEYVSNAKKEFKVYKTVAPYFLAEFPIKVSTLNEKIVKYGYFIRDASNFIGLRFTHGRISLRRDIGKLLSLINKILTTSQQ
ncbi:aspartate aminotransferase [Sulfolobus sp. A20]|uniref:aminotransferase class I/II-fold pyridoxal phosphate-dependent enzyme n=1 Tax=Saccharolobus sp. A20 TaxID=1891280 RepID=UPI0008461E39|nr:aminotransferase class I/II-fold pyridoxal phosphate-dependent enzyme [Sulfolobus sp. A20]TRM78520.1 histidinol-phosphate aminotransferase family protein [Sulfolobus sp. A20-N-F8]TRM82341.1 histidinol-phosphate aminotransferase family protein [Sulfolobus sp. D5]TRM89848.1 histidinol-phosphate aminotransferase family protein [Sulfolobus sp. C3]TRM95365.1 histidinol-phosphate aminotransferase family protein [Sulfolobus sp. A20-N-G8]TRN03041.1 histidinol-phosphate aminotransferase family prote